MSESDTRRGQPRETAPSRGAAAEPSGRVPPRPCWAEAAVVALLALGAAAICLSGNWGSEFWWNDAARHAMDGAFMLDFVRDLPGSLHVYRYATEYYARYPCLGLVHYPPVFPAVEAVFFALFGVNMAAARATVGAFAALGVVFGYLVARRFLGGQGAALFVLLFITAPGVVYWSRDVMLETPVMAMMLASSHFFLGYVDGGRRRHVLVAALLLVVAVLTKQTAGALVPVWVAYAVWRRGWQVLWRRESLAAAGLAAVLLAPFAVATLLFSPLNVGQTIGNLSGDFHHARLSLASVGFYLRVIPAHAGLVALLGIGVLAAALVRGVAGRRGLGSPELWRGAAFAGLWVAACYAIFTFVIANKEGRFVLIWAPGLALLGASGFCLLARGGRAARSAAAAVAGVLVAQVLAGIGGWAYDPWADTVPSVSGTAAAARHLAGSPGGTVVFYTGRFNGNFIFAMRQLDPGRNVVVLRGSKLLFSMPAMQAHGLHLHATTREAMLKVLTDYGVRFLLVEEPTPDFEYVKPVMTALCGLVHSERFTRLAEFPITSNQARFARVLRLYEFLDAGPARAETLAIDMPMSGRVIRVPLRRLGVPTAAVLAPGPGTE